MFSLSLRNQNHHTTACRLGHFIYVLHQCQREEKKCESTFFPTRKNDCHKKEPLVIGKRKLCKIPITAQKSTQHFLPWKKKRISCWARVSNKWPKGLCEWNQMTRIKCTQLSDKMDIWLALSLSHISSWQELFDAFRSACSKLSSVGCCTFLAFMRQRYDARSSVQTP